VYDAQEACGAMIDQTDGRTDGRMEVNITKTFIGIEN